MADPSEKIPAELLQEIAEYIYPDETTLTITRKTNSAGDPRLATQHNVMGTDSFGPIYPPGASPYIGIINWSYGPSLEQIMRSLSFSPSLVRAVMNTQRLAHKNRIAATPQMLSPATSDIISLRNTPPVLLPAAITTNYPFEMLQTLIIDFEAGPVNAYHKSEFRALSKSMSYLRQTLPSLWSVKITITWTKPAFKAYELYERHPLPDHYVYELHYDLLSLLYAISIHSQQCEIVSNGETLKFEQSCLGPGRLYLDGCIKECVKSGRLIPYIDATFSDWVSLFMKLGYRGEARPDEHLFEAVKKYKSGLQKPVFLLQCKGVRKAVYE